MCCDMVDVMLDISSIYGYPSENDNANGTAAAAIGEKNAHQILRPLAKYFNVLGNLIFWLSLII